MDGRWKSVQGLQSNWSGTVTYSLTKIKMFEQCGAKYRYRYLDKVEETQNAASKRGTDTHSALERFIKDGDKLPPELEFYHGFLTQLKQHPVPIFTEERIAVRKDWSACPDGEEPYLLAYIDLSRYVEVSGNLWDWKSGKIYPDHEDQKELYTAMVFGSRPELEVITFTHVYVDLGKNREKVFSRDFDFARIKEKWEKKIEAIENTMKTIGKGGFPVGQVLIPKPQFFCRYCGYSKFMGGPCPF